MKLHGRTYLSQPLTLLRSYKFVAGRGKGRWNSVTHWQCAGSRPSLRGTSLIPPSRMRQWAHDTGHGTPKSCRKLTRTDTDDALGQWPAAACNGGDFLFPGRLIVIATSPLSAKIATDSPDMYESNAV